MRSAIVKIRINYDAKIPPKVVKEVAEEMIKTNILESDTYEQLAIVITDYLDHMGYEIEDLDSIEIV